MKRVKMGPRAPTRSHSGVVAGLLEPQMAHYGARATRNNTSRISAPGIRAYLYQALKGGRPCPCGVSSYQTILTDDGHLTPVGMTQITQSVGSRDRGLEVFVAADFDIGVVEPEEGVDYHAEERPVADAEEIDLLGLDDTRCAQCMGTGFIGGYTLANGYRTVIAADEVTASDFRLDKSERPYDRDGDGTFVEAKVTLPMGHEYLYRLWHKDEVLREITPTTPPTLGVPSTVRFEFSDSWTFIEVVSLGSDIPVDVTTVSLEDPDPMAMPEVTFHIPSDYRVPLFSLVSDTKYNALWQIKQVIPIRDHTNLVMFQECMARRVRPNEIHRKLIGVR